MIHPSAVDRLYLTGDAVINRGHDVCCRSERNRCPVGKYAIGCAVASRLLQAPLTEHIVETVVFLVDDDDVADWRGELTTRIAWRLDGCRIALA